MRPGVAPLRTSYQGNVVGGLATFGSAPVGQAWTYGGAGTVAGELVASSRCPTGYFAFAGGAYFHQQGSLTPAWRGYLTASLMSADDRGGSAVGWTHTPDTRLTVTVRCTDRLG